MFSCEGSAIRFILNQFEFLSKRNLERVRCNFVMNGSGLVVPSLALSGTRSAAIGAVVQPHFRNSLASYCNRLLSGRNTKLRFKFLVASSAFGFENLVRAFNLEFWARFEF